MWLDLSLQEAGRGPFLIFFFFAFLSLPCWVLSQAPCDDQAPTPDSTLTSCQALGTQGAVLSKHPVKVSLPTFDTDWAIYSSLKQPLFHSEYLLCLARPGAMGSP